MGLAGDPIEYGQKLAEADLHGHAAGGVACPVAHAAAQRGVADQQGQPLRPSVQRPGRLDHEAVGALGQEFAGSILPRW